MPEANDPGPPVIPPPSEQPAVSPTSPHGSLIRSPGGLGAIATLLGGVLVTTGSFIPWQISTDGFRSLSWSGLDGGGADGIVALICGVVIVSVALIRLATPIPVLVQAASALVPALLVGIVGMIDLYSLSDWVGANPRPEHVIRSQGPGLYAIIAGAVVSAMSSVLVNSPAKPDQSIATHPEAQMLTNGPRASKDRRGSELVILIALVGLILVVVIGGTLEATKKPKPISQSPIIEVTRGAVASKDFRVDNVLEVPLNAVIKYRNNYFVNVPGPEGVAGEPRRKQFTPGRQGDQTLEVIGGLSEGETIFTPSPGS